MEDWLFPPHRTAVCPSEKCQEGQGNVSVFRRLRAKTSPASLNVPVPRRDFVQGPLEDVLCLVVPRSLSVSRPRRSLGHAKAPPTHDGSSNRSGSGRNAPTASSSPDSTSRTWQKRFFVRFAVTRTVSASSSTPRSSRQTRWTPCKLQQRQGRESGGK